MRLAEDLLQETLLPRELEPHVPMLWDGPAGAHALLLRASSETDEKAPPVANIGAAARQIPRDSETWALARFVDSVVLASPELEDARNDLLARFIEAVAPEVLSFRGGSRR